jgi:hypothetical protein
MVPETVVDVDCTDKLRLVAILPEAVAFKSRFVAILPEAVAFKSRLVAILPEEVVPKVS